ncbi:MAG: hypothetical protein AAGI07_13575 [Bacteroidota bacterium]
MDNQTAGNYNYDDIDNLIQDNAEGITEIEWTVYGKVAKVTKTGVSVAYRYDAAGNRILKKVQVDGQPDRLTHYVSGGSGNVLVVLPNWFKFSKA